MVKSSNQELQKGKIKWSGTIFTSRSLTLVISTSTGATITLQHRLIPRPFFTTQIKNGPVNGLFHSCSTNWNAGHCMCDVMHGNNGNQESWVIEVVCRRLKPDHEKVDRSFVNGWDVFESLATNSENLNASKTIGNKNGIDRSPDRFFPCVGTRHPTALVLLNMLIFSHYCDYNSMDKHSVVLDCWGIDNRLLSMVEVEMLSWWCWLWDHSLSGHSDIYILTSSKWSHLTVVRSHSFQLQVCFLEHRCKNHKQLSSSKVSHQCACACAYLEATPRSDFRQHLLVSFPDHFSTRTQNGLGMRQWK